MKAQLMVTDESSQRIVEAIEAFFETAECDMEPLRELLGKIFELMQFFKCA